MSVRVKGRVRVEEGVGGKGMCKGYSAVEGNGQSQGRLKGSGRDRGRGRGRGRMRVQVTVQLQTGH